MTVYLDKRRNRWSYDSQANGTRYRGYCLDPETGAPAPNRTTAGATEPVQELHKFPFFALSAKKGSVYFLSLDRHVRRT